MGYNHHSLLSDRLWQMVQKKFRDDWTSRSGDNWGQRDDTHTDRHTDTQTDIFTTTYRFARIFTSQNLYLPARFARRGIKVREIAGDLIES